MNRYNYVNITNKVFKDNNENQNVILFVEISFDYKSYRNFSLYINNFLYYIFINYALK